MLRRQEVRPQGDGRCLQGQVRRQRVQGQMWRKVRREMRRKGWLRRQEVNVACRRVPSPIGHTSVSPMISSAILRRSWAAASDADVTFALNDAGESLAAFSRVTADSGSLIQSWIEGRTVVEYEHYPPDDVVDVRSGSQFFYHAHRSGGNEHGHMHLFWHATVSGRRRYVAGLPRRWVRAAPTHLFAIALDDRGLPVSLFTVNRWVTDGYWFDASTIQSFVARFAVNDASGNADSCAWLNAFVRMYRPVIENLLLRRDRRLSRRKDLLASLDDRRLEQLSLLRLDWEADLRSLEGEAVRRRLAL